MKETDLYLPLKNYLEKQGYQVNSEVKRCDLTALKGEELIIIELKIRFSLRLLAQALKRQEVCDSVYVALPIPQEKKQLSNYKDVSLILKRLGIGLILVRFLKKSTRVEIAFHPTGSEGLPPRKRKKKRQIILREIHSRFIETNQAGQTSTAPYLSAYRQQCLLIAWHLSKQGPSSPAQLKKLGTDDRTGTMLYTNLFGWFERISRGIYTLSEEGQEVIEQEKEILQNILEKAL